MFTTIYQMQGLATPSLSFSHRLPPFPCTYSHHAIITGYGVRRTTERGNVNEVDQPRVSALSSLGSFPSSIFLFVEGTSLLH